jgi:DNA-binding PadR family transcriptional regulator
MKVTGWASGKLYPMLAKLEAAGWLDTEVEQIDPSEAKRPPRRWYRLSERGAAMARHEVAAARAELAPRLGIGCVNPNPQGGAA